MGMLFMWATFSESLGFRRRIQDFF